MDESLRKLVARWSIWPPLCAVGVPVIEDDRWVEARDPRVGLSDPHSYHLIVASGCDSNTVLEGFTISGGQATGSPLYSGGGMYTFGGDPTLTTVHSSAIRWAT